MSEAVLLNGIGAIAKAELVNDRETSERRVSARREALRAGMVRCRDERGRSGLASASLIRLSGWGGVRWGDDRGDGELATVQGRGRAVSDETELVGQIPNSPPGQQRERPVRLLSRHRKGGQAGTHICCPTTH